MYILWLKCYFYFVEKEKNNSNIILLEFSISKLLGISSPLIFFECIKSVVYVINFIDFSSEFNSFSNLIDVVLLVILIKRLLII